MEQSPGFNSLERNRSHFIGRLTSGVRWGSRKRRWFTELRFLLQLVNSLMNRSTAGNALLRKSSGSNGSGSKWTFLTNHAHVLAVLHSDPEMVLREVAVEVGITERAVQKILHDLEEEGFIERERVGRRNHYKVLTQKPLRHPIEAHRKIGELLKLINR